MEIIQKDVSIVESLEAISLRNNILKSGPDCLKVNYILEQREKYDICWKGISATKHTLL